MALLGGAQGDDYRQMVELVVHKMEVYCRKASLSTTTIRFLYLDADYRIALLYLCRSRQMCDCVAMLPQLLL